MTEPALITVDGRIVKLDLGTRMLTFRQDKLFAVDIFWSPNQDEKVSKFKEGWKAKVTYEKDKQGKCWLTEIISTYKPGDKPKGEYQQKNEGLILKEVLYKALCDLYIETAHLDEINFDIASEAVIQKMEEHYPRVLKAGELKP